MHEKILTSENNTFTASVTCDNFGRPLVDIYPTDGINTLCQISYVPQDVYSEPSIGINTPMPLSLSDAADLLPQLQEAIEFAKNIAEQIKSTYRLPDSNTSGDSIDRATAIFLATQKAQSEGREVTPKEINAAITSACQEDSRSIARQELDALLNATANDKERRDLLDSLLDTVQQRNSVYWNARENHEQLSKANPDEYDADATNAANRRRTAAHDALITAMLHLSVFAKSLGLKTKIASLNPSLAYTPSQRTSIANLANELTRENQWTTQN